MSADIARRPALDSSRLDPANFFVSLLHEAVRSGVWGENELMNFQVRTLALVRDRVFKFTSGQSTSVPEETAHRLMASTIFCLDARCSSFGTPEEALEELKNLPLDEIFRKGLLVVRKALLETRTLFALTTAIRLETSVVAYNSTLDEISAFFRNYDPDFSAHDIPASIDYPLALEVSGLRGVFYIHEYLERMYTETRFCSLFPPGEIERLLESYGRVYRIDYPEYLLNIFEIVLTNSLFSLMAGLGAKNLALDPRQVQRISHLLASCEASEIIILLDKSIERMIRELGIASDPQLISYIHPYRHDLQARLVEALRQDTLDKLAIPVAEPDAEVITLEQGERMDNADFRSLVDSLLSAEEPGQKARLILSRVRSLLDFVDILKADCLYREEYTHLYETLGDMELTMLVRLAFPYELRGDGESPSIALILDSTESSSDEWIDYLKNFLRTVSEDRRLLLEDLLKLNVSFRY